MEGPARGHPKSLAMSFRLTNRMLGAAWAIVPSAIDAPMITQPYQTSMLSACLFMVTVGGGAPDHGQSTSAKATNRGADKVKT